MAVKGEILSPEMVVAVENAQKVQRLIEERGRKDKAVRGVQRAARALAQNGLAEEAQYLSDEADKYIKNIISNIRITDK